MPSKYNRDNYNKEFMVTINGQQFYRLKVGIEPTIRRPEYILVTDEDRRINFKREKLDKISPCKGKARNFRLPEIGERRRDGSVAGYSIRRNDGKLVYFRHDPVGENGYLA